MSSRPFDPGHLRGVEGQGLKNFFFKDILVPYVWSQLKICCLGPFWSEQACNPTPLSNVPLAQAC